MQQVVDNQVRLDPEIVQERMANATPEQRATGNKIAIGITEGFFAGGPVVGMIFVAIFSVGLMATINFGFGGEGEIQHHLRCFITRGCRRSSNQFWGQLSSIQEWRRNHSTSSNFAPTNLGAFPQSGGHEQGVVHAGDFAGCGHDLDDGAARDWGGDGCRNEA